MAVLSRRVDTSARRSEAEERFVAAATGLLQEGESYADLSVERIAAAAGRTRTAFYFYFRDKRELLMRATEDLAGRLHDEADRWWSGRRADTELAETLRRVLALCRAHAPLLRAVV